MRLLIYGATPLGAYLAAHFGFLDQQVLWLADTPTVEAVRRAGITIYGPHPRRHLTNVAVTDSAQEAFSAEYDAIFFVMPSHDTAAALQEMRRYAIFKAPPPIISLQRGIGNAERIVSMFGAESVIRGALTAVLTHPSIANQPLRESVVLMAGGGVGLADNHRLSRDMAALLSAANLTVVLGNGRDLAWSALLWQMQANAVPALVDLSIEDVYHSPALFRIEYLSMVEALRIIELSRVRLIDLPGAPVNRLAAQLGAVPFAILADALVRPFTPPSLLDELQRGSPRSEVAYLNGAIAIAANDLNLTAPVNHVLALLIQDIAERRAVWSQFRHNPAMLEVLVDVAISRPM